MLRIALLALTVAASWLGAPLAQAQDYPSKPIRFIVGYAPGGATDIAARMVGDGWQKSFGQTVLIENRPGASGLLAADVASKAAPDGYTLMMGTGGTMTIAIHLTKANFEPLKDFIPIAPFAVNDAALIVGANFPAKNLRELVDLAKKSPGKYTFGSSGLGGPTHLAGELLKVRAGINIQHVPYKGDSQALADILGGNLPMMMVSVPSAASHMKSGAVRTIAMLTANRSPEFSDVPTVAESGYPGYAVNQWIAPIAPTGVPQPIIRKLNLVVQQVARDPEVVRKMAAMGSRAEVGPPEDLGRVIREDYARWGEIIRTAGIKLE